MQQAHHFTIDGSLVLKPHLDLGGMDIDIDPFGVHRQEQKCDSMSVFWHHRSHRFIERRTEDLASDGPAIEEKELVVAVCFGEVRFADKAMDMEVWQVRIELNEILNKLFPI